MEQDVVATENVAVEEKHEPLTFDEILNDSEYQREFDKRVDKALRTAKAKWEEEANAKRTEAEKLASMKEAERQAYELEKSHKERDDALAKLNSYELKAQANNIAYEIGVDSSLLNLIDFSTIKAEDVEPRIKELKNVMDKAIEKAVNERLQETTPKTIYSENNSHNIDIPDIF